MASVRACSTTRILHSVAHCCLCSEGELFFQCDMFLRTQVLLVQAVPLSVVLRLAYQSLGVVYGDLGTSPLYVFKSTFANLAVDNKDDIIGALSLIIYTLTIIPLIKYIFIVLRANDNGEGELPNLVQNQSRWDPCTDSTVIQCSSTRM